MDMDVRSSVLLTLCHFYMALKRLQFTFVFLISFAFIFFLFRFPASLYRHRDSEILQCAMYVSFSSNKGKDNTIVGRSKGIVQFGRREK